MTTSAFFFVAGMPVPQGSKRAFVHRATGKVVMTEGGTAEATKRHKSWRAEVTDAAREKAPTEPFNGPVAVRLWFYFLPPASDAYRTHHATSPDIDKLCRTVFDALKVARIITDDSRITSVEATKNYCGAGQAPGVYVAVDDLTELEAGLRAKKKAVAAEARKKARAS